METTPLTPINGTSQGVKANGFLPISKEQSFLCWTFQSSHIRGGGGFLEAGVYLADRDRKIVPRRSRSTCGSKRRADIAGTTYWPTATLPNHRRMVSYLREQLNLYAEHGIPFGVTA
ncbi:MAG TPA: hypothetical protein VNY29_08625 [Terriglobales bacterium]|nr:hypothetical protein [Terriglobales bacterium]